MKCIDTWNVFISIVFRTPRGLEDVSRYPELFAELLRNGKWNVTDLKKVAGLNLLRVLGKVSLYIVNPANHFKTTSNKFETNRASTARKKKFFFI